MIWNIRNLVTFVFVIVMWMILDRLHINNALAFIIIFILMFLILYVPIFFTVLWDSNLKRIEKFLMSRKSKPEYHLFYALAHEIDEEVEDSIRLLLQKYKGIHKQALYKTVFAFYKKEILTVKEEIELIKPPAYKNYYRAIVCIEEGNNTEALKIIHEIPTPWMKNALLSELELKSNHYADAIELAQQALHQSKGLQKYVLFKTYQRKFPEMQPAKEW
ncbi:hypothetical protein ASL14_07415 [Paenibacillus sp. IHB B 3084]|uniref:hypothetical protein n=1 Tax=Paenibacillus sp. IHB B 3084 TaxID=867076 RepID=UPI000720652F|nr:hypothetical protein [Paenibacillus sp. IHB B 3084]ALP36019.1 hypothetical protein ASL14_07415 [Paenibacillus sp. IHB B 3084]